MAKLVGNTLLFDSFNIIGSYSIIGGFVNAWMTNNSNPKEEFIDFAKNFGSKLNVRIPYTNFSKTPNNLLILECISDDIKWFKTELGIDICISFEKNELHRSYKGPKNDPKG